MNVEQFSPKFQRTLTYSRKWWTIAASLNWLSHQTLRVQSHWKQVQQTTTSNVSLKKWTFSHVYEQFLQSKQLGINCPLASAQSWWASSSRLKRKICFWSNKAKRMSNLSRKRNMNRSSWKRSWTQNFKCSKKENDKWSCALRKRNKSS